MRSSFRLKPLVPLLVVLAFVFPQSTAADLLLPPNGSEGIAPWAKGYSTPPQTIRVKLEELYGDMWPSGWIKDSWQTVPFEGTAVDAYVPGVVMGELGPTSNPVIPTWPYNGMAWSDEVVKAMSIMARSVGSYKARWLTEPPEQGIGNSATYQVYRPYHKDITESVKQRYRDLTNMYSGLYLAYNGTGSYRHKVNLIDAEYNNDAPNPTRTGWSDPPNWDYYGYLPSVANPYASGALPSGWPNGRAGAVQLGLQGWAIENSLTTFWQLLSHYYPHTQLVYSKPTWVVSYYDSYNADPVNGDCIGNPITASSSKWINYDWSTGSLGITPAGGPDPNSSIPADDVCLKFTTSDSFAGSWYTFYVVADDGFKLSVDGNVVLNKWLVQSPTMYTVNVPMGPGSHTITLSYFEAAGGAVARLTWRRWNGMLGKYYDYKIDKGIEPSRSQIVLERFDPAAKFAWDVSSPLDTAETNPSYPYPKINPDTFSAIWDSNIYIPPQSGCRVLNFTAVTDDGILVTVNGGIVFDYWYDQSQTTYNFIACLLPGIQPLRVYYYENAGDAAFSLSWN